VTYPGPLSTINVDSDDGNENISTTADVILPIPYNLNPSPYSVNDVFWAVDREYFGG
jgi:hypothetical protein